MKKDTTQKVNTERKVKGNHKYIFVVGGVMSGVGKGIAASSIGALLQAKGFSVNLLKVDPYLNVDAGTMNPTEHGEVFVLNSGLETDQDMGNYERFLNRDLTKDDYITSGMVYKHVIENERALKYGGKCVEAIPHIRDEIIHRFQHSALINKSDITVVEIGGTVGDYQNIMFLEAARVMKVRHPDNVVFVMVSYMPIPSKLGEMKSKPTQNAVRQLNSYGINADIIIARSEVSMDHKRKEKIAVSCGVHTDCVISAPDIDSVFDVPLNFEKDNMSEILMKALHLRKKSNEKGMGEWKKFADNVKKIKSIKETVTAKIPKEYIDEISGTAKILAIFNKSKDKQILGGKVQTGTLNIGSEVKILRRDMEIGRGKIKELQLQKVKASEVNEGYEFGCMIESKIEIALGDKVQGFVTVEKKV